MSFGIIFTITIKPKSSITKVLAYRSCLRQGSRVKKRQEVQVDKAKREANLAFICAW